VGVLVVALLSGFGIVSRRAYLDSKNVIAISRDFYGVLRIFHIHAGEPDREALRLSHGSIQHGLQFSSAQKRRLATAYYGEDGGAGVAIRTMRSFLETRSRSGSSSLNVGAVGLGVGTIAAYADRGDSLRFYEISPQVGVYAEEYFSFLGDANDRGADVKVLIGDARLLLERELAADQSQAFDVLVIDAFSGDAIPVHLLTRECFAVYLRHLDPNGVLAIHVSNKYVDLAPVVRGLADLDGLHTWPVSGALNPDLGTFENDWILASQNDFFAEHFAGDPARSWPDESPERVVWSDDFSSLYPILK
jgi:hypothetical protein